LWSNPLGVCPRRRLVRPCSDFVRISVIIRRHERRNDALHPDILRDLKRINAHITSVAYPILEASGELRESRLRVAAE
jgi:Na+/phosphate symporter